MKIKSILIKNNPILGTLFLDLTDKFKKAVDTIIFAGENGVGKTKILEIIYAISDLNNLHLSTQDNEEREYSLELTDDEIKPFINDASPKIKNNEITYICKETNFTPFKQFRFTNITKAGIERPEVVDFHPYIDQIKELFQCIFAETEVNFRPDHAITTNTTMDLDRPINQRQRSSSENIAREVQQLLVDIKTLDDSDTAEWVQNNPNTLVPLEIQKIRMGRFENAFNSMFPKKKFKGIRNQDGNKQIIFTEYSKECTLDDLSSGEKQIVYRGTFLLKNKNSAHKAFILIDEPEISLHPTWQLQITEFYNKLFTNTENKRTSQIFLATHSPFIIQNALDEKVIVLKKDQIGKIIVSPEPTYYTYKNEKSIEKAFNIRSEINISTENILLLVEGDSDKIIVENAWARLFPGKQPPFSIINCYCASHLQTMLSREETYQKTNKKFIGMFDFDSEGYEEWNNLSK